MSATGVAKNPQLTRETLMEGARTLRDKSRTRVNETESLRRLPEVVLSEIRELRVHRVLQPARYGGAELNFGALMDVCGTVAEACASTGWVLAQYCMHAFMIGSWPQEMQEEIWGRKPDSLLSGSLVFPLGRAKRDSGGYRVSGRWPFASGVPGSDWHMCSAFLEPDRAGEPPVMIMFMLPKTDYELIDNWHVIGLRGTGSIDVKLDNHFVPAHRALTVEQTKMGQAPGAILHNSPLYRIPTYAAFGFVQGGASIGNAQGMYDSYVTETKTRAAKTTGRSLADHQAMQLRVAEAGACIDTARILLQNDAAEMYRLAAAQEYPSMEQRTRYRRDGAFASQLCTRGVDALYAVAGGGALYTNNPMERYFRDAHAINAHITMNWEVNATAFGRAALGLPSDSPAL
ncbi:MAG: acyl-CoA dehydrogenase [Alphaproteobacteria bacterium]|nr:acyl-CoA dehydrogenase [Alphaproteobacteria bacterium]